MHRYALPLPREEVWTLISEVSHYRLWRPWLRAFDAAALAEGEEWRCEVQLPVFAPGNTALQVISRFAAPIARFGHDWVLDSGARQFIARAVVPLVGD